MHSKNFSVMEYCYVLFDIWYKKLLGVHNNALFTSTENVPELLLLWGGETNNKCGCNTIVKMFYFHKTLKKTPHAVSCQFVPLVKKEPLYVCIYALGCFECWCKTYA